MSDRVTWWKYEHGTGKGWYLVSSSSDAIEKAFQEGETHIEEGDLRILIPLMIAIDKNTGAELYLVRKSYKAIDPSSKPWQFELSYGQFVPMKQHLSSILTIARNAGYKKFIIRDESTFQCLMFDFENCTQTNLDTKSMRTIVPAPLSKAVDEEQTSVPDHISVPDYMLCPVSQLIMTDPVMAQDGQNYDRYSIETWFATGKVSSPLTGQLFVTPRLYSNHCLREQIAQWKKEVVKLYPDFVASPLKKKQRKRKAS
jgi:hypothetical protein